MATVGVLCARVRVEEKQLMAALAEAGAIPTPLPPANVPLPVGPLPTPSPPSARVIIDRSQDRAAAAAILAASRALGATTLDAGLAATGDRLAVATALAAAGLPRPQTRLTCSPEAALLALDEFGFPGTLLPLSPGAAPVDLLDGDAAEAILEHRSVLGTPCDALALVQAGTPAARATVMVVDGRAVAMVGDGAAVPARALALAEAAADALGAAVVGIEIALTPGGPVVWDAQAVPEYRHAAAFGEETVATALAASALARLGAGHTPERPSVAGVQIELGEPGWEWESREVHSGVALSA